MKALLGAIGIVLTLQAQPALAAPPGFRPGVQADDRRAPQRKAPAPREVQRERRAVPDRDERRSGRLTEEERRELRRDVDRANRELYRRRPER